MKRILMVTVATVTLLWSTTTNTAFALALQTRTFKTNLVKGEYVEDEAVDEEPEEFVGYEPIDVAEEIITDWAEITESEPQESDEHTDVSTSTDIESVVDEEPTQSEEPVDEPLDAPENIGDSTESETENPIDSEEDEEEHETEVQGSE